MYCHNHRISYVVYYKSFYHICYEQQYASASLICVDYSSNTTVAKIRNCELPNSDFHRVDLFSELSRNMTPSSSSSDLFEGTTETELSLLFYFCYLIIIILFSIVFDLGE